MQPLEHSPGLERFATRRVAVLVGDRDSAEMLHMFFRLMDLECSLVTPDFRAVATVRRLRPDVLILDLDLPHLRALDFARELRQLPMILITDCEPQLTPIDAPVMRKPHDRFEELLRLLELVLAFG